MQFLLVDKKPALIAEWNASFKQEQDVRVLHRDITQVTCDAIVSPANSFGFMDGGVDYAISMRLGWSLQDHLQEKISVLPEGELLVGKALVIPTGDELIPYLISAPTMRVPMNFNIATSINAYLATKAALIVAISHPEIQCVAIPGMCTGVGRMPASIAASQMHQAYLEIVKGEKTRFNDFYEAQKHQRDLNPNGLIFD